VLSHLLVDQEPGHRRRIAVKPTGGRVFFPADGRFARAVEPWRRFPSALADWWTRSNAVAPARPRRLPACGPQLGRRARASRLAGLKTTPRPT
jgi:hypothetical protein